MPTQHSTGENANQEQGIVVPLELAGLRILKQEVQTDGRIRVEVIATTERATCAQPTHKNGATDWNSSLYPEGSRPV